jgi:hypothetical protein
VARYREILAAGGGRPLAGRGVRKRANVSAACQRAFPPDILAGSNPLSWSGRFSEIPAALVVRGRNFPNTSYLSFYRSLIGAMEKKLR